MKINNLIKLDPNEIVEKFSKSSGPGGQHINKVDTKVELRFFAIKSSNLSKTVKDRLKVIAGNKWTLNGEIIITAEKYRSQVRNRELARSKFPGSSSSLDALCKRYRIDNSRRVQHTALIDCDLLAKVYINLIDQKEPTLNFKNEQNYQLNKLNLETSYFKKIITPSKDEISKHKEYLKNYLKKNYY